MSSHITMNDPYRPKKLGFSDRAVFITQESEVQFRAINAAGTCQLIARAEIAQSTSSAKWQLRRIIYDQSGFISAILWPLNALGLPSRDYRFSWADAKVGLITAISQAMPCHITAQNSFTSGDLVYCEGIMGMTQLNFTGQNLYKIANATSSGFDLAGVDSTNFTAYTGGGTAYDYLALQNQFG